MRGRGIGVIAAVLLVASLVGAPAQEAESRILGVSLPLVDLAPVSYASANVDYLGTIPLPTPGVSARVVDVEGRRRLYVSGIPGLAIYDVTNPARPALISLLPLPNWENEDIAVSADGDTAIVTEYTAEIYMHVIDTSIPLLPRLASTLLLDGGGHTMDCLDDACDWLYGSEGQIVDLRNKSAPRLMPQTWTGLLGLRSGHAMTIDGAGIAIIDTTPLAMVDISDPLQPRLIAAAADGEQATNRTAYQHNNLRPRAGEYRPRTPEEEADPALRPGELILGNGETNLTGTCNDRSGPFATWSARGFHRGDPLRVVDVYRPVTGTWADGNPALNVLGCSGHWFTEEPDPAGDGDVLVAAGWYEHGTRFLHVDAETGAIDEVGYWQPIIGSASAAYWVGDGYVYVIDYARGIDVLRFDPGVDAPTRADIEASWLARAGVVDLVAQAERAFCRIAAVGAA